MAPAKSRKRKGHKSGSLKVSSKVMSAKDKRTSAQQKEKKMKCKSLSRKKVTANKKESEVQYIKTKRKENNNNDIGNNNNNNNEADDAVTNNNNNNNNNNKVLNEEQDLLLSEWVKVVTPGKDAGGREGNHTSASSSPVDVSPKGIATTDASPKNKSPSQIFRCEKCGKEFPNRYFRRKHLLMAHEDQFFECRVCSFNSVDPEKLKSHIIKLHLNKKVKNESSSVESVAQDSDDSTSQLSLHKIVMEDGVVLGKNKDDAKLRKASLKCDLCNRRYVSKYSLERHLRVHTGEKPYQCVICDFSTSYREHMARHTRYVHLIVHSKEPKVRYPQKKKDEDEDDKDGLKRRKIMRKRFECAACGALSSHKSELSKHIKEKHPNAHIESLVGNNGDKVHLIVTNKRQEKPKKRITIVCDYCRLVFHDTWKYKVHMRSHTGVKPFECSVCEFRATSKMTIRDHTQRHHPGEECKIYVHTMGLDGKVEKMEIEVPLREFRCDICNETFNENYHYKQHRVKSHPEALPFSCVECGHRELGKANLILHCLNNHPDTSLDSLILRNNKPYRVGPVKLPKCNECNKYFAYQSLFYFHMKKHTGEKKRSEKKLSCYACEYTTNLKKLLQNHIMKYHLDSGNKKGKKVKEVKDASTDAYKILQCAACDFSSSDKLSLLDHIITSHADKSPPPSRSNDSDSVSEDLNDDE